MAKRLSKSGIEYLDYVWSFYSGCWHKEQGKCPPGPCWAEEMVGRFKGHYPNGFEPTFYPEAFLSPLALKKPSRIGVCFMGDLFGDWVEPNELSGIFEPIFREVEFTLKEAVYYTINKRPQHTFVFLTKNPAGMKAWSPFPGNCEVGFSAWSPESFITGLREITKVVACGLWCSMEPLLAWSLSAPVEAVKYFHWVAIGALTGTKKQIMELAARYPALTPWKLSASSNRWGLMPTYAWLKNIVEACDAAGTKVFLKDNLYTWLMESPFEDHDLYWADLANLRQECGARDRRE